MKVIRNCAALGAIVGMSIILGINSGCATKKQTGALAGAGVGALIGQAIVGHCYK
jgi:hypothetical protein